MSWKFFDEDVELTPMPQDTTTKLVGYDCSALQLNDAAMDEIDAHLKAHSLTAEPIGSITLGGGRSQITIGNLKSALSAVKENGALHDAYMVTGNGMPVIQRFGGVATKLALKMSDSSFLSQFGVKGKEPKRAAKLRSTASMGSKRKLSDSQRTDVRQRREDSSAVSVERDIECARKRHTGASGSDALLRRKRRRTAADLKGVESCSHVSSESFSTAASSYMTSISATTPDSSQALAALRQTEDSSSESDNEPLAAMAQRSRNAASERIAARNAGESATSLQHTDFEEERYLKRQKSKYNRLFGNKERVPHLKIRMDGKKPNFSPSLLKHMHAHSSRSVDSKSKRSATADACNGAITRRQQSADAFQGEDSDGEALFACESQCNSSSEDEPLVSPRKSGPPKSKGKITRKTDSIRAKGRQLISDSLKMTSVRRGTKIDLDSEFELMRREKEAHETAALQRSQRMPQTKRRSGGRMQREPCIGRAPAARRTLKTAAATGGDEVYFPCLPTQQRSAAVVISRGPTVPRPESGVRLIGTAADILGSEFDTGHISDDAVDEHCTTVGAAVDSVSFHRKERQRQKSAIVPQIEKATTSLRQRDDARLQSLRSETVDTSVCIKKESDFGLTEEQWEAKWRQTYSTVCGLEDYERMHQLFSQKLEAFTADLERMTLRERTELVVIRQRVNDFVGKSDVL